MSHISSKIDALDKLYFEPFPSKVVSVVKMCKVEGTTVALGKNGTIYSTGVKNRLSYSCHGDTGALSRTLDACIKLGVLTAKAVKEHKDSVRAYHTARDNKYHAEYLQKYADQLGVKLTTAQMKKIAAFKEFP